MPSDTPGAKPEQRGSFRCAACDLTQPLAGPAPPPACPRCDAEGVIHFKADGSSVTPPLLSKAQGLASESGVGIGYALAILGNHMTMEQARSKRNREAAASGIAERHQLSLRLAYRVADGKMTVPEALRDNRASTKPSRRIDWKVAPWFAAAVVVFAWAIFFRQGEVVRGEKDLDPGAGQVTGDVSADSAKVTRNSELEPTLIEGPSAESVVNAYCKTKGCDLNEISPIAPQRVDATFTENGKRFAMTIAFDGRRKVWAAGEGGTTPIRIRPVPE